MTKTFATGMGKTIEIGREIGTGGEGSVYEIPESHHLVAKLYNVQHLPDLAKQAKLRFMATVADSELIKYAAWPQDTLHKIKNGPAVGFLMPKVSGRKPIHILYSPAHRKQEYPNSAWDFLVFAARNTAAAFSAIHQHGHVLGDVNQGNVLVGSDSKVVLIDTDSFQICANGTTHMCKVGVAHFTPPELQGIASFDRVPRTTNHDNFGLALLIFHLLFGGRHPYSGVPLRMDAGEALEKDIQAFRYAYSSDGQRRGFKPPPNSIPISIVPDPIQAMFTLAFTENGASGGRPTAQQWLTTLDELRQRLKRCASTPMHLYPSNLGRCPWCALEDQGVIYFYDVQMGFSASSGNTFVLTRAWAAIEAVRPPPLLAIPNLASIAVTPRPMPPGIPQEGILILGRIVIVALAAWFIAYFPDLWFLILCGAIWSLVSIGNMGGPERNAEKAKRQTARDSAQNVYDQVVARLRRDLNPDIFNNKKQDLVRLRDEYQQLSERERSEITNLQATAESRQKQKFLERHFIDVASISGVGAAKKAALRSFGIETAADVTWNRVIAVKGFGEVLTRAVVDWRKACERQFSFNPKLAVTESDKNAVRARIAVRKRSLEIALTAGGADLLKLRQDLLSKSNALSSALQASSQNLAQALADLRII